MVRTIIHIDEAKCNGCGLCAKACHEGAIDIIDGKAKLMREHFCDGLGDCLPGCPTGAISFEQREAPAYDEAAVKAAQAGKKAHACPGTAVQQIKRVSAAGPSAGAGLPQPSQLQNWPVQIKLAPLQAPYYQGAELLIAADCTAYAYAAFHRDFIAGKVTLIGCPKLDATDYSEKLGEILANNDIQSVSVVRMQVPCCGGLELAVKRALAAGGKDLPLQVTTLTNGGRILV